MLCAPAPPPAKARQPVKAIIERLNELSFSRLDREWLCLFNNPVFCTTGTTSPSLLPQVAILVVPIVARLCYCRGTTTSSVLLLNTRKAKLFSREDLRLSLLLRVVVVVVSVSVVVVVIIVVTLCMIEVPNIDWKIVFTNINQHCF